MPQPRSRGVRANTSQSCVYSLCSDEKGRTTQRRTTQRRTPPTDVGAVRVAVRGLAGYGRAQERPPARSDRSQERPLPGRPLLASQGVRAVPGWEARAHGLERLSQMPQTQDMQ